MCQYINIILPIDAKADKIKSLLVKHGFGYHPFHNSFVLRQFNKGILLVNTTSKQCDCGSVIFSHANHSSRSIQSKDIERLRSKGWSETKINNWIANKTKTDIQVQERDTERNKWIDFLHEAIWENHIGMVGLHIHWYDESISNEEITFKNKEKISLSVLQGDMLDNFKYDILYEFTS